jgi:hypothetical protein
MNLMKEASQSASLVPPRLGPFGRRISGLVSGCGLKPFQRWGEERVSVQVYIPHDTDSD